MHRIGRFAVERSPLQKTLRPGERIIHSILFLCALLSVFVTVGFVIILGRESWRFFTDPAVNLVEYFTSTRWQPIITESGILPQLNATLMISLIAMLVARPRGRAWRSI